MTHSIADIAAATGLEAAGDLAIAIRRPAEPAAAGAEDLALAMSPKYEAALRASSARAAVVWPDADWRGLGLQAALFAPRARLALAGITGAFAPPPDMDPGIHPTAVIDPGASLGDDVWIGPFTTVRAGAQIGAGARIAAQVSIGSDVEIGEHSVILPGVRLSRGVRLGARCLIQANACIGGDGFSYVTPERGAVESAKDTGRVDDGARNTALRRISSLGTVVIGDDVEIGAATCIDRGTVADTMVGSGTKIDNQVMLGHNVRIGSNAMLCGQVGIAGSCTIGDRCVLGGRAGVGDHIRIGDDCVLAGGTLVGSDVRAGSVMMGVPAMPREQAYGQIMALKRLPKAIEQLREIRAKLGL
ncbi:MAG: UDP-3-O-(3-hydroxymyristoyl)glucosamine N-acyltransferase [Pseudomonadota bacterium]